MDVTQELKGTVEIYGEILWISPPLLLRAGSLEVAGPQDSLACGWERPHTWATETQFSVTDFHFLDSKIGILIILALEGWCEKYIK